ncbi:MAG: carboxyvinyl-carboxyphosphonate phosphorylmutase [Rhodospirillales bacterium]|nr:carboxyvinyl-carboxyphosphonate phosphorylmutase [Rhodospirillales bacterium]
MTMKPATRLRAALAHADIVVAPGVFDAMSALLATRAGFGALFLSGSAASYAQLARPDLGLVTLDELALIATHICERVDTPLMVDIDQGFGSVANVQRAVRAFERAGAAGVQLEDQIAVKPAASLQSRPVLPLPDMLGKLRAAQDARHDKEFLISARTDAYPFDEALTRAVAFADAGADLVFVECLRTRDEAQRLAAALASRVPLVSNCLEGRPHFARDAADLQAMGFHLALYPGVGLGSAVAAMEASFAKLAANGSSEGLVRADAATLNQLVETERFVKNAMKYSG